MVAHDLMGFLDVELETRREERLRRLAGMLHVAAKPVQRLISGDQGGTLTVKPTC
jgi:plasmid maintenance system antidote protein VapI